MPVKSINSYTATVTPKLAEAWLEQNYTHQRPVRREWVGALAEAMRRGNFSTSTIKFALLGTDRYLFNGQHTLHAIIASGRTITLPVQDHLAESMEDVQRLYYHEDIGRRRIFADSARAVGLYEETGLSRTQVDAVAAALKFAKANFGVDRKTFEAITFDDSLEMVRSWQWEAKAIWAAITPCGGTDRNMVIKQSVLGVALITMRYATDDSREFWRQVAQDDGLERYDARKTLRQWLLRSTTRSAAQEQKRAHPHEISRAVALAWNAWCDGRLLRYMLVRDATKVIELRKCGPFNGNQSPNFVPLSMSPQMNHAGGAFLTA